MSTLMTVTSLNTKIKSLLEATFMHILVEGEVASATYHTSGHLYFSVKDEESSIKCVMWRSSVSKMKFRIEKGMKIVIEGSLGVYTPRGEYQFYAVKIEPSGHGALALAFEQLKERLKAKGYFASERKKTIPIQIQKIVLVTAKDSAALHDMLKIIEKRWALLEVLVVDTLVQGDAAAAQIARSLRYADTLGADVVVVGRGGGSTEDLWAFNEEVVADAIYQMKTPIVSAVGHEVDVLISDYVSDLRAPTPSAAIEMILPDSQEIRYMLDELANRMKQRLEQKTAEGRQTLLHLEEMLHRSSPASRLQASLLEFQHMEEAYKRVKDYILQQLSAKLSPLRSAMQQNIHFLLQQKMQHLEYMQKKMEMQNPKLRCQKGWAQVLLKDKKVTLSELKEEELFVLEDASAKIEALCVKKSIFTSKKV